MSAEHLFTSGANRPGPSLILTRTSAPLPKQRKAIACCIDTLERHQLLAAVVQTGQPDYAPNSTAIISTFDSTEEGKSFAVGEAVRFWVHHTDGMLNDTIDHRSWVVVDGSAGDLDGVADGRISTRWYIDGGSAGSTFRVRANGLSSHAVAFTNFAAMLPDAGGNPDVDTVAPTTAIKLSGTVGANNWYTSAVTVTLTASDADSGVAQTFYSLDDVNWLTYTGPFEVSIKGVSTLQAYSVDLAANTEPAVEQSITIDTVAPTTTVQLSGTLGVGGCYTTPVTVTLNAGDDASGIAQTFYSLDGTNWLTYTGAFEIATKGVSTLQAYSVDLAGNTEPAVEQSFQIATEVVGRRIFYNNSLFDGNNPAAQAPMAGIRNDDDDAIATDKSALLPGQTATFTNYTSYSKGINGIMVDIAGLTQTPTANDFTFKVGNSSTFSSWTNAPAPASITSRDLGNGVRRVTIIWADGAIRKQWLQVTVKATAVTGLDIQDVFYFGNAVGETGNVGTNVVVNASDNDLIRANNSGLFSVPITNRYDINRDGRVNATDVDIARANASGLTPLRLIAADAAPAAMVSSLFAESLLSKTDADARLLA